MKIKDDSENPYSSTIRQFLIQQFPRPGVKGADLLEALTAAFVASNNLRFGPVPLPENLVAIRQVIRLATTKGDPIPILIPWGGRKADPRISIDVAEVMAMRQVEALQKRVQEFYTPGIQANMRLEDINAYYLFDEDGTLGRMGVTAYVDDMVRLLQVLGMDYVAPMPESLKMDEKEYRGLAGSIARHIEAYLEDSRYTDVNQRHLLTSFQKLRTIGWTGLIPDEQREFYLQRYRKLYPNDSDKFHHWRMAQYLGGALARVKMGGVMGPDGPHIQLAFTPPVPGSPDGMFTRRLYYRTLPASMARTHIPAWRAKGYLRVGSEVTPKLATFNEVLPELQHCHSVLTSDDAKTEVSVDTDYVLA